MFSFFNINIEMPDDIKRAQLQKIGIEPAHDSEGLSAQYREHVIDPVVSQFPSDGPLVVSFLTSEEKNETGLDQSVYPTVTETIRYQNYTKLVSYHQIFGWMGEGRSIGHGYALIIEEHGHITLKDREKLIRFLEDHPRDANELYDLVIVLGKKFVSKTMKDSVIRLKDHAEYFQESERTRRETKEKSWFDQVRPMEMQVTAEERSEQDALDQVHPVKDVPVQSEPDGLASAILQEKTSEEIMAGIERQLSLAKVYFPVAARRCHSVLKELKQQSGKGVGWRKDCVTLYEIVCLLAQPARRDFIESLNVYAARLTENEVSRRAAWKNLGRVLVAIAGAALLAAGVLAIFSGVGALPGGLVATAGIALVVSLGVVGTGLATAGFFAQNHQTARERLHQEVKQITLMQAAS